VRRGDALLALAIVAAAALCVRLGVWQLSRYQQKKALNGAREAALAAPPVRWDGDAADSTLIGRRVTLHGRYDATLHVLLAYREHDATTGVEVVTPLVLENGARVLVDRGWVPADDGVSARPQDFPEPGDLDVVGVVEPLAHGRYSVRQIEADSARVFSTRALDADSVAARIGAVAPFMVRQSPGEGLPGQPRRSAPEPLPTGMHMGYAIQWFVVAIVTLGGGAALLRQRARKRSGP